MIEDYLDIEELSQNPIALPDKDQAELFYNDLLHEKENEGGSVISEDASLNDRTIIEGQKSSWIDKKTTKVLADSLLLELAEKLQNEGLKYYSDVEESSRVAPEKLQKRRDSYYSELKEYEGIVQDVFDDKFRAVISRDGIEKIAEFDLDDLQYPSDRKLIKRGALFVWLIGKETRTLISSGREKDGPQCNFSKIVVRRTYVLSNREKEQVRRDANEWAEFFRQCATEEKTRK